MSKESRIEYVPGLDGIRAIAILAILLFHYWPAGIGYFSGGFIGVDIFFTVSGFLITTLLLTELENNGSINIKNFWLRRARRLLPAFFLFLILLILSAATIPWLKNLLVETGWNFSSKYLPDMEGELASLKPQIVAALVYSSNWYLMFKGGSYFENVERPPLLEHFWSLAIEEQFYLVWPILMLVGLKYLKNKKLFIGSLAMIGLTSILLMLFLGKAAPNDSRAYFGTDTRAYSLIIGALLAYYLFSPKKLKSNLFSKFWITDLAGLAGLASILFFVLYFKGGEKNIFQGGLLSSSLASSMLIISVANKDSKIAGWVFGNPILSWLGKRSYGLYIWHWPIFILTEPAFTYEITGWNLLICRIIFLFGIVELSYVFIEQPIRNGAIERYFAGIKNSEDPARKKKIWKLKALTTSMLCLIVFCFATVTMAKPQKIPGLEGASLAREAKPKPSLEYHLESFVTDPFQNFFNNNDQCTIEIVPVENEMPQPETIMEEDFENPNDLSEASEEKIDEDPQDSKKRKNNSGLRQNKRPIDLKKFCSARGTVLEKSVTAIGDSVMLGAKSALKVVFGDIDVNAVVSRQFSEVCPLVEKLKNNEQLSPYVFIHLGTNGTIDERQLIKLLDLLKDREKVVVMNVRAPRSWQESNNRVLEKNISQYPNVILINWRNFSSKRKSVFYKDGIHLNHPGGACFYASLAKKYFQ